MARFHRDGTVNEALARVLEIGFDPFDRLARPALAAGPRALGAGKRRPHGDQVVRDHAESDPTSYSFQSAIATPAQPVPPFQNADSPFAAGPPSLRPFEPTRPWSTRRPELRVFRFGIATRRTPMS